MHERVYEVKAFLGCTVIFELGKTVLVFHCVKSLGKIDRYKIDSGPFLIIQSFQYVIPCVYEVVVCSAAFDAAKLSGGGSTFIFKLFENKVFEYFTK